MFNWGMRANLASMGLLVIASVFLAGCGANSSKKISPEAAQTNRLDWNLKTTVAVYENTADTDPSWDKPVTQALTEFARTRAQVTDSYEPWAEIITTNCDAAVKAGCDDPMVRYLYIRYCLSQTNTPKAFLDAFEEVQSNMQQSPYPPIRKFYASLRALQQFNSTYDYNRKGDFSKGYQLLNDSVSDLVDTLNDKTTPPAEVYDASHEFIYAIPGDINMFQNDYAQIEKPLFANWSDESVSWLLKGEASVVLAWIYRGNGYADSITPEGAKGFNENLDAADKALNHAWKLDPTDARIAVTMIGVELGQGQGRDRMEMWFNRAMKDNPNDYDACAAKLNYLLPRWYGSEQDMVDFGHECVSNTDWGGTVPLTLVDAHYQIDDEYTNETDQMNYWKQPDVWTDISSSYERYFQNYPDDDSRWAYYARYAYYAGQWKKLNELLPKVKPEYYYLFGGTDAFNQIVQSAKANASQQ
jgi:hypothetical protein